MNETNYDSYIGKFYGPRKIAKVSESHHADTPSGFKVLRVDYDGGYYEFIPSASLDLIATTDAKDFNHIRDTKFKVMLEKVLSIIGDYDLQVYELDAFMSSVLKSMQDSFNRAMNFLWNKDDLKFIPGEDPHQFFTVAEAQTILKGMAAQAPKPTEPSKDNGAESGKTE